MYKVVTMDEFGLNVTQEDGFETPEEAQQEAKECIERWGEMFGQDFWVEPYEQEPYKEPRNIRLPKLSRWVGRHLPNKRLTDES